MDKPLNKIVIVGGGTAGWLTAAVIAADHRVDGHPEILVSVIESPQVATIGVGEGTWPSMRHTLGRTGISETEFIVKCGAAFKQGSKFVGWRNGAGKSDFYYHPFTIPLGYPDLNLAYGWQALMPDDAFAETVSTQQQVCEMGLAPKQKTTPEYASVVNYAYHLDAGKFGDLLQKHCCDKLGVEHIQAHVTGIESHQNGDIASIVCEDGRQIAGDLFIDCSGFNAMLLGKHYKVPLVSQSEILFNDSALAVQVPYSEEDTPIASATIGTAQRHGWIWDIGLSARRGVGHVYSSTHASDDEVEEALQAYLAASVSKSALDALQFRKITFSPGHRRQFWYKNCVAVGSAAGFIEPLEASALALVELSAAAISDELPANRRVMEITAERFNRRFSYHWERIIEFLKLHYVLSERTDSEFWLDNRRPETVPQRLTELLELWRYQAPSSSDLTHIEELFSAASYQYVLYGMGYKTTFKSTRRSVNDMENMSRHFKENKQTLGKLKVGLPTNRALLSFIGQNA